MFPRAACICDCGKARTVDVQKLKSGQTVSCGCHSAELASKRLATHGKTGTPEHVSWVAMKARCYYEKDKSYPRYGGRGISVWEPWRISFERFLADMGPRPSPQHSLDRIDNGGNYEPGNCRWATPKEQAANTSIAHRLELGGERVTLAEMSRRSGFSRSALRLRMSKGESADSAASRPYNNEGRNKRNNKRLTFNGESLIMAELCEREGVSGSHMNYYLRQGLTADAAVARIKAGRTSTSPAIQAPLDLCDMSETGRRDDAHSLDRGPREPDGSGHL